MRRLSPGLSTPSTAVFIFRVCLASIVPLKFRAYRRLCEQAPLLLMHKETAAVSPLMSPYQMNVAYYETWRSQLGGFVDEGRKKKGGLQETMKETLSKIDHTVPL